MTNIDGRGPSRRLRAATPLAALTAVTAVTALTVLAAGCTSAASGAGTGAAPPKSPAHAGPAAPADTTAGTSTPPSLPASSPTAVAIPDSCLLLTRAEARRLISGAALAPGVDVVSTDPVDYSASCTYTAPPTSPSGQVEIFVTRAVPNALTIDRSIHRKFRTVPGIADQAIEEPDNSNIFVRKGSVWVYLTIPFGATPKTLERGARLIAARVPTA